MKQNKLTHKKITLEIIKGLIEDGFEGVHKRQDITNGRIAKAEDRIRSLETTETKDQGIWKGVRISWQVVITILGTGAAIWGVVALYQTIRHP